MRVGSLDAPRMAMDRGAKSGVSPAKRDSVMRFPPDRILCRGYSDAQGMDTNPTDMPLTHTRIQALARRAVRRAPGGLGGTTLYAEVPEPEKHKLLNGRANCLWVGFVTGYTATPSRARALC